MSLTVLLAVMSLVASVLEAMGKCPPWVPDVLLSVTLLLLVWGR